MMNTKNIKTYFDLITIDSFLERYRYLRLPGKIGEETFGCDRYLNQMFYRSDDWRSFRRDIIIRDNGCEMGLDGYPINGIILIHHIVPITKEDILERRMDILMNPNNVVCVSKNTHNAIHYGDETMLPNFNFDRTQFDTCPWRLD